jgi:hypothetical protein
MPDAIVLADEKTKLFAALSGYASALSNLTPEQVPAAIDMTLQLKKLAEEVYERLRDRLIKDTQEKGYKATDKGTMEQSIGGFKVRAIPTKTGTDPKKLEAKLRALGMQPENYMDATMALKVNAGKLALLVATKTLTLADVAYDPSFRVQVERE